MMDATPVRKVCAAQCRVLLLEDDLAVRDATRRLLKMEGYSVVAAASIVEALQQVDGGGGIDLVIADYHLGRGETDSEAIAKLRQVLGASLKAFLVTGDPFCELDGLATDPNLRVARKPAPAEELFGLIGA